jgi:glucose-1-phosphate thymidylyltransferase
MIYYPLSVLMLSLIREVLVITDPVNYDAYRRLLGTGEQFGIKIQYEIQEHPAGLAQAFLIGEEFLQGERACLVLGDNIFYGQGLSPLLRQAVTREDGAVVFAQQVRDPHHFGIVEFDSQLNAISIEEKPASPRSNYAVTGLYFYDKRVVEFAKAVKPSARGELEITSINEMYLHEGKLKVELLGRGFTWLDTGTPANLLSAANFVETIERQQGFKVACLEEIAFANGWIDRDALLAQASNTSYGDYLRLIADLPK